MITDDEMIEYYAEKYGRERVDQAVRIYGVLVEEAGAWDTKGGKLNTMRQQFIHWFAQGCPGREFRFQGHLGFGGKFWDTAPAGHVSPVWHVNYYSEDHTKERKEIERVTNERLAALQEELEP